MPFDPFGDFESAGYLRNVAAEKDIDLVKHAEHQLFRARLPVALDYLSKRTRLEYRDFLEVHRILFGALYPWAGLDRAEVFPDQAVRRGTVYFSAPSEARKAVEYGLHFAQEKKRMAAQPGHIMGLFAFGHPFLDGNGRTMLIVHAELCFRAGMSIDWARTQKNPYLNALTQEITDPNGGHLDDYLRPFIAPKIPRQQWEMPVGTIPGPQAKLATRDDFVSYEEPGIQQEYSEFERRRGYDLG